MELLERDAQLARLSAALESATDGAGRLVLVRGEAGMGKTSLVSAFLRTVEAGAHLLVGVCDDLLTRRPLGPLWDMATIEPLIDEALRGTERQKIHSTMFDLLARSLRPSVVVIEDVHWADDATLDLIRYLGRRIDGTHGLLIITYRDEEIATDHPLRFVLGDLPPHAIERLVLEPLTEDAVRMLAERAGVARELHAETNGNPFFVTELLAAADHEVPLSVVDTVRGRVARLTAGAVRLVELVSVVPGRAELSMIQAIIPDWPRAVDEAEQRGVLVGYDAHVGFRHELARRAIEGSLASGRRAELNRDILSHLLATDGDRSRIVHHAVEAADADVLLEHAPSAAAAATEVASHQEAYDHFRALRKIYHRLDPRRERDCCNAGRIRLLW